MAYRDNKTKRSAKSENARQGDYGIMEKCCDPKAYERFKAKPYQLEGRKEKHEQTASNLF